MVGIYSIQSFWLFDSSIDILVTFEFSHDVIILKMSIINKVDSIGIKPTLKQGVLSDTTLHNDTSWIKLDK